MVFEVNTQLNYLFSNTDRIYKAFDDKTIFWPLRISPSFDTVDHEILLKKLNHNGIRDIPLKWFRHISPRKHAVQIDGVLSQFDDIICGIPSFYFGLFSFFYTSTNFPTVQIYFFSDYLRMTPHAFLRTEI